MHMSDLTYMKSKLDYCHNRIVSLFIQLVRRLCAEYYMNCALWAKSMKFGVRVGIFMLMNI